MTMGIYAGKKVLIIGGTGTIGQHLLRRILLEKPEVIRILSRDEHKQYELQLLLSEHRNIRFLVGDVRDADRVSRAMQGIDYVFHAAAMKHVPACEYNPFEAVQTNVIGTQNVIQAAINNKVQKVLFTSTDKAISPTNTYGATKLTAERLISAAEFQKGPIQTIFSSVRFGNVMGSRGSVIPLFKKQILENGYVTVTDLNMVRYMMTPREAIALMLKANELAQGGEVFVLKMPVVRIKDLAEAIIELMREKHNLSHNVGIKQIGLRPGEKMYEELMTHDEKNSALETEDMFIVPPTFLNISDRRYSESSFQKNSKLNASQGTPIDKETLKDWLLTEQLV